MKKIFSMLMLGILLMNLASADLIEPGHRGIAINNHITNIDDYSNYILVSYGGIEGMCPIEVIGSDGRIPDYYKYCNPSVYAIPKEKFDEFNQDYILVLDRDYRIFSREQVLEKLSSIGAKEVIKDIQTYEQVLVSSSVKEINNFYTIDLSTIRTEPDDKEVIRNDYIYFYILIPLIAITIILYLIFKKRK